MTIDHIGYLCRDINKSIQAFLRLGFEPESEIFKDNMPCGDQKARNVFICFMKNGDNRIELVSPINEKSDVYMTINRNGEGPYHICYRVENLDETICEMKQWGWMIMKRPAKAIALNNSRVAFMFRNGVGIIELAEIKVE